MKCFNCNEDKLCLYSPKELTKYKIAFCKKKCLSLIKNNDLRYLENTNKDYVNKEIKKISKKVLTSSVRYGILISDGR